MKERLAQVTTVTGIPLLTDDRSIRTIGVVILIATFGILGTWGYLAPIDSAALAPGYVTVKSHRKTVQHLDGGIVSQLMAKDGDVVKAGDVLLILDGTEVKAQLEIIRGQHITLSAQIARLMAERDQQNQINFPDELHDLSDPHIAQATHGESQLFSARKSALQGEISVLNQRISQLGSKIKGLQGQRSSKEALMISYGDEVHDLKELLAEGFADKQRLRDIERNHAQVTGEVAALSSEIAGNEIQIGETKLQILQLQKKFQEEVALKLGEVQAELYDVAQRLVATRDKVARTVIIAPANGRVLGLSVHNVGGVISPGKPILDIVPQQEELIIDAQVSPMDIDRVRAGLLAEVRFSAFKQALTPKMQGKVINLSADRLTDEKTEQPYYLAQIELTPDSFQKLGDLELLPGMPAEVLINTGERTVFEYLMQPITNAFARAFIED
ncbi:HlyD family type I secretion periplasmic adaptor subunit [Methylobacter sp. S3L5C]|uniref:HlyD family type I secretion periplasmic adaptor subunit n=1 Tax=Methylobacter sp. S3L5C TaxID=2839024 RepID=UPI001FAC592C|nr:HlyD family type I secretion periplasmic adaptor subunit [Methylobacter sp. S3L5C]UOA08400.1 HlyD family type I secretion periplasmic adaptor subunit [Methylobacter sp. S3L5C]